MFTLSKENKEKFQQQVNNINQHDESKVRQNIEKEISILENKIKKRPSHKLEHLIENTKLLYEILSRKDFPISESTRKWIVFGLGYLISDIDLIPDSIPGIGYLDDAMIVSWVLNMIDQDVTRFEYFKKAKKYAQEGNILKELVQGNGEQLIILIPGFLENSRNEKEDTKWLKSLRSIEHKYLSTGYSLLSWNIAYLPEFSNTITLIDHKLSLKPQYDSEAFGIEWQQLKLDMKNLGMALLKDIKTIIKTNPEKEIIIIAINIGSIAVTKALSELEDGSISRLFLLGATSTEDEIQRSIFGKSNYIYNIYSANDHAIKFIYDNYEEGSTACGLKFIRSSSKSLVKNIDAGKQIARHHEYRYELSSLIIQSLE